MWVLVTYRRVGVYSLTSSATRTLFVHYKDRTKKVIIQEKKLFFYLDIKKVLPIFVSLTN